MALELGNEQPARVTLAYALHSGNLYGTERMALHTAAGLADRFNSAFLAPPGPALQEAVSRGFASMAFSNARQFAFHLRTLLARNQRLAFLATGVMHSAWCLTLNKIYRRKISHLHLVHGGACERLSYGRKKILNGQPVTFVAVSRYVSDRLVANGVRSSQIEVIENFLPAIHVANMTRRQLLRRVKPRRIIVISRLDPEKRVGLLIDALEMAPDLQGLEVSVFGTGWELETLRRRAASAKLNVHFQGFTSDIGVPLAESDLLVHLCPVEPFGLAILEAIAAGIPVLVPNSGGAGSLIEDEQSGFQFRANSAQHLVQRLRDITAYGTEYIDRIVETARVLLQTRFAAEARIGDYRRLLLQGLS